MKRTDERDVMFSRNSYKKGTPQYADYYARHPERQATDDELREKLPLCSEGTPTYHPLYAAATEGNFILLNDMKHLAEGPPIGEKQDVDVDEVKRFLVNMAGHYGALNTRVCSASDDDYYSHRGRHPDVYGDNVDTSFKTAIIFTVGMDKDVIDTAPQLSECMEVSFGYVKAATIGLQLAYAIRVLGYNARVQMDANYLLPLTPLAAKAGLGQFGRHGLLISKENGGFIRLGAVTTDLPLTADAPVDLGLVRFCKACGMCVRTCPAKTISGSDNPKDWRIEQEKCYTTWRNLGSDCGVCLSACPLAQGIDVADIKDMTDEEIKRGLDAYRDKHGPRNYNKQK